MERTGKTSQVSSGELPKAPINSGTEGNDDVALLINN